MIKTVFLIYSLILSLGILAQNNNAEIAKKCGEETLGILYERILFYRKTTEDEYILRNKSDCVDILHDICINGLRISDKTFIDLKIKSKQVEEVTAWYSAKVDSSDTTCIDQIEFYFDVVTNARNGSALKLEMKTF